MAMDLPELEPFTDDWKSYIDHIYEIYRQTILLSGLRYNNLAVKPRYAPESLGKHFGFWHLTSEGETEEDREPDLERCERIRWVQWVIENFNNHEEISCWQEKRSNISEIVIWVESENYVVVLSERRDYWLLKTAYMVKYKGKVKQLTKNRDKYMKPRKI